MAAKQQQTNKNTVNTAVSAEDNALKQKHNGIRTNRTHKRTVTTSYC